MARAEVAREVLEKAGIVVFPGFEVETTEKVHWVCLFPEHTTEQQLDRYLGRLKLTNPQNEVQPPAIGGAQLLAEVEEFGGFCYAAHVTSSMGVLKNSLNNLWKNTLLRAAQIPGDIDDLRSVYKEIILNKNPGYARTHQIAPINAKDIAVPEDLRETGASTFIKMTTPCFASFLMAFKDPKSRVRLSGDMVENHYSQIQTVSIEGGYYDDLSATISGHLNTVIGGRGTGKSTLLECIRYALDVEHKGDSAARQGDQIVRENLGRGGRVVLKILSAENHMKPYTVIRRYGEPPRVIDEQGNESRLHPGRDLLPGVEIYGQNEIYELARSPDTLTRVLDRFLPENAEQLSKLKTLYRNLTDNSDRLIKARDQEDESKQRIAQLPRLLEQAKQFREQGLEDKLKRVPLLEKERQLGSLILEEIARTKRGRRELEESLPDLVFLSDKVLEGLPHADLLKRTREALERLGVKLKKKLAEMDLIVNQVESSLVSSADELDVALADAEKQLEQEFSRLPSIAGKGGKEIGRIYQNLVREIEAVSPVRTRLKTISQLVGELEQSRRNLLGEISDIRGSRTRMKQEAIRKINKRLKGKLRIELVPDGLRKPLRDFLQALPGIGESRTRWIDEAQDLTVPGLVAAIEGGKEELLGKGWGLTSGMADTLAGLTRQQRHAIEAIDMEDRISLELNVSGSGEQYRPLHSLSTGQQCTAILHLLLIDNRDPLIMDQPEDNLDNAFIAERIVQELRSAKTERQFLFATHNANIPVFGDAEWIGVCSASEDRAEIAVENQGSIDIPTIRDHVTKILEGGREAFIQRKEKYGIDF